MAITQHTNGGAKLTYSSDAPATPANIAAALSTLSAYLTNKVPADAIVVNITCTGKPGGFTLTVELQTDRAAFPATISM